MIAPPLGWRTRWRGDRLLLEPAAAFAAIVEYREVVRPLAPVAAVVAAELAREPRFEVNEIGEPEELVTHEGELGALVTVAGRLAGRPAQRDLGFVLTDAYYALASSLALAPAPFEGMTAIVRALIQTDTHMLGVRRRRFRYQAPPAWTAAPRGLETSWLPPGFPQTPAAITVWPAWPADLGTSDVVEGLVAQVGGSAELTIAERLEPQPVAAGPGLRGAAWDFVGAPPSGRRQRRTLVLLEDGRYVYPVRLDVALDGDAPEHRAALFALVASAQPVPHALGTPAAGADAVGFWLD